MPAKLILMLLLSSICVASPEYQDWLSTSRGDSDKLWSLTDQMGSSKVELDVSLPEFTFPTIDPGTRIITTPDLEASLFDLATIENYIPPIINGEVISLDITYFGLDLRVNVSRNLVEFWKNSQSSNLEMSLDILQDTQSLGNQLLTLRQHYQWNDWELIRLIQHVGLQLNDQIDVAIFQWILLKHLGYEVKLAKQNNLWFLLFASKQTILNYASLTLGKIPYYIFPNNLMTNKPVHSANDLYSNSLDADLTLEVYFKEGFQIGQRFNLMLSPDAYYGSNWSELILSFQGGRISLPVSLNRYQALKSMPSLPLTDLLSQDMPTYQYQLLKERTEEILSGFELTQKKQWLQRLVHSNFSDQLPDKHEVMAAMLGITAYKNKSYIRAYMLLHLLEMTGVSTVVAIETSTSVFITEKDNESTVSPVMVNSQYYIPVDMNGQPGLLPEYQDESESLDIIILN